MGLDGAVLGVVSRKVLPACGGLCYLCPSLRPRSRQPVKRYKKILADIFPTKQVDIFPLSRTSAYVSSVPWFSLLHFSRDQMRGGLGSYASMLLEILIVCQRSQLTWRRGITRS